MAMASRKRLRILVANACPACGVLQFGHARTPAVVQAIPSLAALLLDYAGVNLRRRRDGELPRSPRTAAMGRHRVDCSADFRLPCAAPPRSARRPIIVSRSQSRTAGPIAPRYEARMSDEGKSIGDGLSLAFVIALLAVAVAVIGIYFLRGGRLPW